MINPDPISFMWGVILGQISMILGIIFSWIYSVFFGKLKKVKQKKIENVCPYCGSKRIGNSEKPGVMFCAMCFKEFNNVGKPNK